MRSELGADLVTYWFEKSRAQIEAGILLAAGLVSTNSIRGGANRKVLERIIETTRIFEAWSDEEWGNDGAAVRVSLFGVRRYFPACSRVLAGWRAGCHNSCRFDGWQRIEPHASKAAC